MTELEPADRREREAFRCSLAIEQDGRTWKLEIELPANIGRSEGSEVVIGGALVSRRHARLEVIDGAPCVTDLGGVNGTKVNGGRLVPSVPRPLQPGDELLV